MRLTGFGRSEITDTITTITITATATIGLDGTICVASCAA